MTDYKGPIWVATLVSSDGEWKDEPWYGSYDSYMDWIDSKGYDVADVWQIDMNGNRIDEVRI
jgi:hypothetical protein